MNNFEIYSICLANPITRPYFVGVFSADRLPTLISVRPAFLIVNTARYKERGKHWVCLFLPKQGPSEYFDSLADTPGQFQPFLLKYSSSYVYNNLQIQSSTSNTCGQFCIFFANRRCEGEGFFSIISQFRNTDIRDNESFITEQSWLLP